MKVDPVNNKIKTVADFYLQYFPMYLPTNRYFIMLTN